MPCSRLRSAVSDVECDAHYQYRSAPVHTYKKCASPHMEAVRQATAPRVCPAHLSCCWSGQTIALPHTVKRHAVWGDGPSSAICTAARRLAIMKIPTYCMQPQGNVP